MPSTITKTNCKIFTQLQNLEDNYLSTICVKKKHVRSGVHNGFKKIYLHRNIKISVIVYLWNPYLKQRIIHLIVYTNVKK